MGRTTSVSGDRNGMSGIKRRLEQFLEHPSSIRYAVAAITSFTVFAVVIGALVVRVFDRSEYPTFGSALWFTLQTVTTVGYGDVTPTEPIGRVVASIVMLTSIGLITVITAAVTSTFVAAAARRDARSPDAVDVTQRNFDELARRLGRIEQALDLGTETATRDDR